MLRLDGVHHTYPDGTTALGGVDLDVASGEHVCLVGDSEAGKSTLLRVAAGGTAPTAGTVASGPVGWLLPTVQASDLPWVPDFVRLHTIEEWCARPGAVLLADSALTSVADHEVRDRYHGALIEARARGAAVLSTAHERDSAEVADRVLLVHRGRLAAEGAAARLRGTLRPGDLVSPVIRADVPLQPLALNAGAAIPVVDPQRGEFVVSFGAQTFAAHGAGIRWLVVDEATHRRFRHVFDRRLERMQGPLVERRWHLFDRIGEQVNGDASYGQPFGYFDGEGGGEDEVLSALWTVYRAGAPGAFDPADCARIIAAARPLVGPGKASHRADDTRDQAAIFDLLGPVFARHLATLINCANRLWRLDVDGVRLQVLRYGPGNSHGAHVDMFPGSMRRKVSLTVQLSAPSAYAGGRLHLADNQLGWRPLPAEQGTAVVWPAWTPHRVDPVTAGERWSLVVWAYGPPVR